MRPAGDENLRASANTARTHKAGAQVKKRVCSTRKVIFVPCNVGVGWIGSGREELRDNANRILHEIMGTPEKGIPKKCWSSRLPDKNSLNLSGTAPEHFN